MKAVVHIGTEKTGTTSIQQTFQENAAKLSAAGAWYPRLFFKQDDIKIAAYAMDDEKIDRRKKRLGLLTPDAVVAFRKQFEADFDNEIRSLPDDTTVLIVNEHLSRLREVREVERLRDLLLRHFDEIEIVVYLRRQDKMMRSMYSTVLKVGGTRQNVFPAFTQAEKRDFTTFDYGRIMELWSGVWGKSNLTVRVFDRKQLHKGDVVLDFLHVAGVRGAEPLEIVTANQSMSHAAHIALREMNKHLTPEERGNLGSLAGRLFPGRGMPVARAEATAFLSHFEEGNRQVARCFLGREELFEPIRPGDYPEEVAEPEIGVAEVAEVFGALWAEKNRMHRAQLARARRLQRGSRGLLSKFQNVSQRIRRRLQAAENSAQR